MAVYVGLDIGGTKLRVAASDGSKRLGSGHRRTPEGLSDGLRLLHEMIREVTGDQRIDGIGAAVGGPLDHRTGIVSPLHQPEWRNVPLKRILEERWGCPCHVDVDTNVGALGEYDAAADKPARLLYMTVSTGIGGGFIVDGHIYRGAGGVHPEIGHQSVPYVCSHPDRVECECGAGDCLEGLVSGNGIRRVYGVPAERLRDEQWREVAHNLGQGLRNLAVIYLPDTIVLGGGVALGRGEALLAPARRAMRDHLKIVPPPEVRLSALGDEAPLRGALLVARQGIGADD